MCQSTYDYCGPVVGPDGQMCDFRARRGSILAAMPGTVVSEEVLSEAAGSATTHTDMTSQPGWETERGPANQRDIARRARTSRRARVPAEANRSQVQHTSHVHR